MKTSAMDPVKGITLVALGLAIAVMGIYVAGADDAPGAAVIGMLLMVVGVVLGLRVARKRLPIWAARTALAVDVVVAAFAAFLAHDVVVRTPLFAQSPEVPSVVGSAPSLQHTAAVERAGARACGRTRQSDRRLGRRTRLSRPDECTQRCLHRKVIYAAFQLCGCRVAPGHRATGRCARRLE